MDEKTLQERRRVIQILQREIEAHRSSRWVTSLLTGLIDKVINECDDPPANAEELLRLLEPDRPTT